MMPSGPTTIFWLRTQPADPHIQSVGDVQTPVRTEGDSRRESELGLGGRTTVAAKAKGPVANHGGDDPVRPHPADATVPGVGDVQAPVRTDGNPLGGVELGLGGRAAVAAVAGSAVARHRGDDPVRPNPADA